MDVDLPNILKRCLSAPIINNLATPTAQEVPATTNPNSAQEIIMTSTTAAAQSSSSSSREASPAPMLNIFAPRARRYSASFASLGANGATTGPRLTPRVSQLRQEECADMNSREVNHEREVHSAMQMSQSWEDLTLVAENWSCKSDDLTNPLQVTLPTGTIACSSPSPTSRAGVRLPYGLSPSPTRRTFATRRSMSPIAMRPSQLGPVKRKFELDDNNWNTYSPPPLKKVFTESRGPSPICQSPSSICPSPDSGTYEGRTTPKLFVSKLYTNSTNSSSSLCSSPMAPSPMMEVAVDLQTNSSSPANMAPGSSSSSEPMSITSCESYSEFETTDGIDMAPSRMKIGNNDIKLDIGIAMNHENKNCSDDNIVVEKQPNNNILLPDAGIDMTEIRCNFSENSLKKNDKLGDNSVIRNVHIGDDKTTTNIADDDDDVDGNNTNNQKINDNDKVHENEICYNNANINATPTITNLTNLKQ